MSVGSRTVGTRCECKTDLGGVSKEGNMESQRDGLINNQHQEAI